MVSNIAIGNHEVKKKFPEFLKIIWCDELDVYFMPTYRITSAMPL
jgi:hypothetical protein